MHDVVVIGAGPAGAMAAARLAGEGHQVVILEEHPTVGAPVHCTGLLGAEAFTEFDLPASLVLGRAESARFVSAAGQSVVLRSDRVDAMVIDRAALDRLLVSRATEAGAVLHCGWRAESMAVGPTGAVIRTSDDRAISARVVVLACGANYRFHRELGLGLPSLFLQSAQVETAFPAHAEIEVQLGREIAPSGFAWLVPLWRDGVAHARIGLMSESHAADRFRAFLTSVGRRAGIAADDVAEPRYKMLPLGPVRRSYADRVVAVGDAAGLVKPTTGGGIYYGMLSGALAGEVVAEALDRDRTAARNLRAYEKRWRQRLGQEMRVATAFRSLTARLPDEAIDALIELARVDGVAPLLQQTASFNWHRKAAVALLGHPEIRRIMLRTWTRSAGSA